MELTQNRRQSLRSYKKPLPHQEATKSVQNNEADLAFTIFRDPQSPPPSQRPTKSKQMIKSSNPQPTLSASSQKVMSKKPLGTSNTDNARCKPSSSSASKPPADKVNQKCDRRFWDKENFDPVLGVYLNDKKLSTGSIHSSKTKSTKVRNSKKKILKRGIDDVYKETLFSSELDDQRIRKQPLLADITEAYKNTHDEELFAEIETELVDSTPSEENLPSTSVERKESTEKKVNRKTSVSSTSAKNVSTFL
jgi:hypothetical protein